MSERLHIVTLHRHEDLEGFYTEMEDNGFRLSMKRPLSRNTHYWMTDEQAENLRQDSRVWAVELTPEEQGCFPIRCATLDNNRPDRLANNRFWKSSGGGIDVAQDTNWGLLHCTGDTAQRDKGQFGIGGSYTVKFDVANVFGDGRHVDVVICDDPVSADCGEWASPTKLNGALGRFVQYDWFNELNSLVTGGSGIDDDGIGAPTGNVTYYGNAANPEYHGTHVAGTAAGQFYGWASEANIYGLQILGTMPSGQTLSPLLLFDYLRAFHRNKPVNPVTGHRNPTISNHSWGYSYSNMPETFDGGININDITEIFYGGVTYNSGNPGPSGWTIAGVEQDFGIGAFKYGIPSNITSVVADAQDAVKDGIVVIAAAGNSNFHIVPPDDINYGNFVRFDNAGGGGRQYNSGNPVYFNRGMSPGNAPGVINVGSLNNTANFTRSGFSNFGPGVDIFAPGQNILSAWGNPAVITGNLAGQGISDTKYNVGTDWLYPINGTSMASPQVAGVAACVASHRRGERFDNDTLRAYLRNMAIEGDMTFDTGGGHFADNTCRKDSPNSYLFAVNPRDYTSGPKNSTQGDRHKTTGTVNVGGVSYDLYKPSGQVYPRPRTLQSPNGYPQGPLANASQLTIQKFWRYGTAFDGDHTYTSSLYIPSNENASPFPVIICLHGNGGNGNVINNAPYNLLQDHIRIGPNGFSNSWNIVDENSNEPDVQYLRDLITLLKTFSNVDTTRIRISGISNGAALACRAFLEIDDPAVDIVAPIVSQLHAQEYRSGVFYRPEDHYQTDSSNPTYGYDIPTVPIKGRKLLMIQNTNDPTIPYNGGSGVGIQFMSAQESTYRMAQSLGWAGGQQNNGEVFQNDNTTLVYRYNFNGNENEVVHASSSTAGHGTNAKLNTLFEEYIESDGQTLTVTLPTQTWTLTVTASSNINYTINGTDRINTHINALDPVIRCDVGDILTFNVTASGHPFYIKTSFTGGSGNQVTTGTVTGTQGTQSGSVSWNTAGVTPGTYYYVCSPHASFGMGGSIVVS